MCVARLQRLPRAVGGTPPGGLAGEDPASGGPRQVGKTTLLLELRRRLGERAIYAAADGPEASVPGFWERLWAEAERKGGGAPAVLLLDEIQNLPDWALRLKGEWDRLRRRRIRVQGVATRSAALHLGRGSP